MAQVELQRVSKAYSAGDRALNAVNDVSLTVNAGDFISIVGHSGSGKTTLLSLIGGIIRPTAGRILIEGADLGALGSDQLSEYRAVKIGFMFQFASLLPMLTVRENILLPAVFRDVSKAMSHGNSNKAETLLTMVGLTEKMNAYPSQLSGGQQRRVAIARAFMNCPALILADEPTGDLDEGTENDMMQFFKTMNENEKITFIMVTHNTDLARQTGRQLRMHQGLLQES